MREIKFRVWSNPNMRYVQDEDDYYVRSDGQFVEISLSDMFNELNPDRFIFEQYAGLKDKNGKEIFEGDILYHKLQGERVVYYPFNEHVASYGLREISSGFCSTLQDSHRVYEVIGNIHENPEQLEWPPAFLE